MKPIIATAAVLATLLLASCTSDDNDVQTTPTLPPGAVHLTGAITGTTATRATVNPDGSGTFADGDVWGMYTLADGKLSDYTDYRYGTTVLYWEDLSRTDDVTFLAHYPRQASVADPAAYDFDVAAAAADGSDKADLLTATATGNRATNSADNPVRLPFAHRMHSLRIHLTAGTGVDPADIEGAEVTPTGMKSTARVDFTTGLADPAAASGDTPYPATTVLPNTATGTFDARLTLAPQPVTTGADWLQIRLGSDIYIYKVPAKLSDGTPLTELKSGYRLTLNLTLTGKHTVELTASDISKWNDQGSIDGEIDMADGVRDITDLAGFVAALTSQRGTAAKPARYVLKADIEMNDAAVEEVNGGSAYITVKGHKLLDGGGHTLTRIDGLRQLCKFQSSSDAPSSLELTNVTLADKPSTMASPWFDCGAQNCHWTLGKGVNVTTASLQTVLIEVSTGATLTVDGATFTNTGGGSKAKAWIRVADGTLVLKDINFTFTEDYIWVNGNNAFISLRPGMNKSVRLRLASGITSITPTEGSFRAEDAMMLTVDPRSIIGGAPAINDYAFYLDPADGNLKLHRTVSTLAKLKAAIASATGTADRPATIVLGADIEAGNQDLEIGQLNDKTIIKHIHIDGRGHTLTYSGTRGTMSYIYQNNSLTLTNVTIDGGGKDVILLFANLGTVTLGGGATVTNTGSGVNACVYLNGSTLRMKPGSAVTGAKDWGIYSNLSYIDNVFFEGGTLSGNRVDVRMPVSIVPLLTVGVWPKMNGAAREKLTIEIVNWDTSYENPVAKPAPPLASLEPGDFDLVKVTRPNDAGPGEEDVTAQTELYKAGDGSINIRLKPTD